MSYFAEYALDISFAQQFYGNDSGCGSTSKIRLDRNERLLAIFLRAAKQRKLDETEINQMKSLYARQPTD